MFYLVNCDTYNCVDFQAIVGISDNKQGVMELLFNYHKLHFTILPNISFENLLFDIQIFKINEENYNYLLEQINNKEKEIDEYHKIHYNNFKPECSHTQFLFVMLVNDLPKYDIFDKEFHKKYNKIIKKSKQIII